MNTDDFEQRLQRQQLRQVPVEWRAEILRNARAAVAPSHDVTLLSRLRDLLWPARLTWAPLAAAWLIICALYLATPSSEPAVAKNGVAIESLATRQQMLAQLLGPSEPAPVKRPRPQSQLYRVSRSRSV